MTTTTITASAARIDIVALAQRIAADTAAFNSWDCNDEAKRTAVSEEIWSARALLARTPARTVVEIKAKASVLMIEAERDIFFECDPDGSARDLAMALARDVLALADG
jgi:hypothetical protein